jgi:hypothetical protein
VDATHNYFGTLPHGINQIGKTEKKIALPLGWTPKLIKRSARTKAPVPWLRKMITETSLLPLNTLITSVKESNN